MLLHPHPILHFRMTIPQLSSSASSGAGQLSKWRLAKLGAVLRSKLLPASKEPITRVRKEMPVPTAMVKAEQRRLEKWALVKERLEAMPTILQEWRQRRQESRVLEAKKKRPF